MDIFDLRLARERAIATTRRAEKRLKVGLALAACHPESKIASNDALLALRTQYDDAVRAEEHAKLAVDGYAIMTSTTAGSDADLADLLK